MIANEKLWTVREVAELLHMHRDTVIDRIDSCAIRASNVGTDQRATWVVRQSDLDDYLNSRTNETSKRTPRRRNPDSSELDKLLTK